MLDKVGEGVDVQVFPFAPQGLDDSDAMTDRVDERDAQILDCVLLELKVSKADGRELCVTITGLKEGDGETEKAKVDAAVNDIDIDTVRDAKILLGEAKSDTVEDIVVRGELLGIKGDEVADKTLLAVGWAEANEEGDASLLAIPVTVPALTGEPVTPLLLE